MNSNESERLPAVIEMARTHYAPPLQVPEEDLEEARVPLSQYLWILKRYRWRILGFCAVAVAFTVAVSSRLTPIYEATATIDIDRQTPSDVVGQDSVRSALNDSDQFLATQMKLVESDSVLRPVDQRMGLRRMEKQSAADGSPQGEAAPVKLNRLRVARPPNTYLMLIHYRAEDPVLASDAANAIAQSYLEHTYNIRVRSSASMATFMERQMDELRDKMERSGTALAKFERDLHLNNPDEKTNILAARLLQLNTDYTVAQTERLRKQAAQESVSGGVLEAALATPQGDALRKLAERVNEARERLAEARAFYGANHPEFRRAQATVDQVEKAFETTRGGIVRRVEIEFQESQRREQMGAEAVAEVKAEYLPVPPLKNAVPELYFHFDSWRVNLHGSDWIPAQIYVEEAGTPGSAMPTTFKAQTRIWDYNAASTSKLDELTQILIDSESGVRDDAASRDVSPLESQRAWERQAEENVLARLEKGGLLAPAGPVDDVLNTVVNNLIVSAHLNIDARCRVLLTTPIETFSIGRTIVISRGLIDVLPDETSLALVLADELSHIALGHPTPTQFAFHNQTMMSDAELFTHLRFERPAVELDEAGLKTIEIIRASPYQKTGNAGLFLKALNSRTTALPRLLAANMGNQLANASALARLSEFTASAPELDEDKLEQIAALPLGSRVKLNPASGRITLTATKPLSLLSAREKMPFEVTPFVTYLVRAGE